MLGGSVSPAASSEPEYGALENDELKSALRKHLVATHRTAISYSSAQGLIVGRLSVQHGPKGEYIKDVYCEYEFAVTPRGPRSPAGDDGRKIKVGSLNVEHTWPQSKFGQAVGRGNPKSDLHHLFPADKELNARRGNFKFGDVDGRSEDLKCAASRLSKDGDGKKFEAPDGHKGNVARALFYFAIRYAMPIDSDEEKTLKDWNRFDPVDAAERSRNEEIEKLQGDRNPFIDHPEWAERISDF